MSTSSRFWGRWRSSCCSTRGSAVYRSAILLLCNNPFCGFIARTLRRAGATVEVAACVGEAPLGSYYDAILVSLTPQASATVTAADAGEIARRWPGAVVAQFWGDIDREALAALDVPVCPAQAPAAGHMAILPSAIGPEAVIRLQAGGLKVGERCVGAAATSSTIASSRLSWRRCVMHNVLLIGSGITAATALQSLATTCRVVGVVRDVPLAGAVTDEVARLAPRVGAPILTDTVDRRHS